MKKRQYSREHAWRSPANDGEDVHELDEDVCPLGEDREELGTLPEREPLDDDWEAMGRMTQKWSRARDEGMDWQNWRVRTVL